MFPLIIESTKVVIANPARPNGAGFAGDHPALGALGVGALGVTEASKSTLLCPAERPLATRHYWLHSSPRFLDLRVRSFDIPTLPVVRIRTQGQSIGGANSRQTVASARRTVAVDRRLAIVSGRNYPGH